MKDYAAEAVHTLTGTEVTYLTASAGRVRWDCSCGKSGHRTMANRVVWENDLTALARQAQRLHSRNMERIRKGR